MCKLIRQFVTRPSVCVMLHHFTQATKRETTANKRYAMFLRYINVPFSYHPHNLNLGIANAVKTIVAVFKSTSVLSHNAFVMYYTGRKVVTEF